MIVAAPLYPPREVTEPLQLDAGGGMELPFHIGHILEGIIFLNARPGIGEDVQGPCLSTYAIPPP